MAGSVKGIEVEGAEPKELKLSDGSKLWLETEPVERGRVEWRRAGDRGEAGTRPLSLREALELAGDDFAPYVAIRTRAEAEWLRTVADWYRDQAEELSRELEGAR